jgi:hypothetical protein
VRTFLDLMKELLSLTKRKERKRAVEEKVWSRRESLSRRESCRVWRRESCWGKKLLRRESSRRVLLRIERVAEERAV